MSKKPTYEELEKRIAELEESQEFFEKLLNMLPELVSYIDKNHKFRFGNKAYSTFFNIDPSSMAGLHPEDVLGKDAYNQVAERQNAALSGQQQIYESSLTLPNGELCFFHANYLPHLKDNQIEGFLAVVQDITERKQAKKTLIESEQKWRNILVNTPLIGISIDSQSKIVFVNKQFLNLTGWKKQDVIGQKWFDLLIPESVSEDVRNVFNEMIGKKESSNFSFYENEILTKSGERLNIAWSNVVNRDADGKILDITCLGVDLTERLRHEKELIQQKRLFETMFNTIPDGVIITNTKREIQLANTGMNRTFGYTADELFGKQTKLLYATSENYEKTGKDVFKKDAKKTDDIYITHYKHKNGREFPGETFGAKLFDENNQWIGNLGVMRNISDRLETQKRLQQAQKMESIGSLAGGIAHDFNNILFPILGMSELLLEDLPTDSIEYENVQEINKAGKRAKELVTQILAFSRQSEHNVMPVRFQKVLKEVLKLCRSTIPANIDIEHHIQADCGSILANATQLHQIAMNLITNAYHAVQDKNGKIVIEFKEIVIEDEDMNFVSSGPGEYAVLSVTDNGTGMSEEIKSKIFDPYFTTKEKGKGTGLGLAVVYGIVKEFGGDIKVYTEVGSGTTFNVYLPLKEKSADTKSNDSKADIPTGDEQILLVDDEPAIARLVQLMLERLGYTVTVRLSSIEALEAFKEKSDKFDMVISDMSMPNMTGDQLAREIREISPDMPIIICTGFSERINKDKAKETGVNGFLMKPVIRSDMAQMIRKVLDEGMDVFE